MSNLSQKEDLKIGFYQTPAGVLKVYYNQEGIFRAIFTDEKIDPNLILKEIKKLVLAGTEFQIKVWKAALEIPAGKVMCYGQIAKSIGHPKAYRAVANALANNKIAYFVPCHRVLKSNYDLCGYKWGVERKANLLKSENYNGIK